MFRVNNKETRTTPWRQWRHSGVFIVNFEHISHLALSSAPIANSEQPQVNAGWAAITHAKEPCPSLTPALYPV